MRLGALGLTSTDQIRYMTDLLLTHPLVEVNWALIGADVDDLVVDNLPVAATKIKVSPRMRRHDVGRIV